MKSLGAGLLVAALAGCASYGTAGDYDWLIDAPPDVSPGADLVFTVRTVVKTTVPAAEGRPAEVREWDVEGKEFHFIVLWPGGSTSPLRRIGRSGEELKLRARAIPGKATLIVLSEDAEQKSVKVAEASFEVR